MNFLKTKSKVLLIISFLFIFLNIIPVFAKTPAEKYGIKETAEKANLDYNVGGQGDPFSVVGVIISSALGLVAIVFFGLMLYAGLRWMTAMGDSTKVDKAKNILEASAIGLIIIVTAYAIVNYVFEALVESPVITEGADNN